MFYLPFQKNQTSVNFLDIYPCFHTKQELYNRQVCMTGKYEPNHLFTKVPNPTGDFHYQVIMLGS